jgi:hypothetical protein
MSNVLLTMVVAQSKPPLLTRPYSLLITPYSLRFRSQHI